MSDIIYFKPNARNIGAFDIEQWGLGYAFDNPPAYRALTGQHGPEGNSGLVFGRRDAGSLFCNRETQNWFQFPDKELWFGWDKSGPPVPYGLSRPFTVNGHEVELAGHQWIIPMARRWNDQGKWHHVLKRTARFNGRDWEPGEIVPKFERLWEIGIEVFDSYMDSDDSTIKIPENPHSLASDLLSVNYYLGPAEAAQMQLIPYDANSLWAVLRCVMDEQGLEAMLQKKTTSD